MTRMFSTKKRTLTLAILGATITLVVLTGLLLLKARIEPVLAQGGDGNGAEGTLQQEVEALDVDDTTMISEDGVVDPVYDQALNKALPNLLEQHGSLPEDVDAVENSSALGSHLETTEEIYPNVDRPPVTR